MMVQGQLRHLQQKLVKCKDKGLEHMKTTKWWSVSRPYAEAEASGGLQALSELFKVLGDPTRLRILHILMGGERRVGEIADLMDMGQSAISHQLRVLRQARLVSFRKEGKTVWYSLDDDHVESLMSQGLEHVLHK